MRNENNLKSEVRVGDAEKRIFDDKPFDLIYSYGALRYSI